MCHRSASLMTIIAVALLSGSVLAQGRGPSTVRVDAATTATVQQRRMITGELRPVRRSKVATEEGGRLVELLVREGDRVAAGDLMARLDSRRLDIMLQQMQADLAVIDSLRGERQTEAVRRERDLALVEDSFERGAANQREVNDANSVLSMARARVVQADGQALLTTARADLLRERLADMKIIAPYDGVVVGRHVELGEWVGEGDPVVELVSTGPVEVWLNVPQRHLGPVVELALPIEVHIDATDLAFETSDIRIIPDVDARARTFTLIATLANADGKLVSGMSVKAWVPTGEVGEQLTVAKDAVLRNESGPFVYVVRGGGDGAPAIAVPVLIDVQFSHGDRVVVRSPELRAGDRVVIEGNERLFPMTPVAPIESPIGDAAGGEQAGE